MRAVCARRAGMPAAPTVRAGCLRGRRHLFRRRVAGELPIAARAQCARRAGAAAIAPVVQRAALAEIAGVGAGADQVHQRRAAQLLRQFPGLALVAPHQRRFQLDARVHAEVERHLQGLHRVVAAVGITGEIGLAHAADQHRQAAPVGHRGRHRHEQQVATGDEGVRQAVGLGLDGDIVRHRRLRNARNQRQVDHVVFAETFGPQRRLGAQLGQQRRAHRQLDGMALAVIEADGLDARVTRQRPRQTGGGILSTAEQDQRGISSKHRSLSKMRRRGGGPHNIISTPSFRSIRYHAAQRSSIRSLMLPAAPAKKLAGPRILAQVLTKAMASLALMAGMVTAHAAGLNYEVRIDAPGSLAKLLEQNLDLLRFRGNARIDREQLQRMVRAAPEQVKTLVATDGYYSPVISATYDRDAATPTVRVTVQPGEPTLVAGVELELLGFDAPPGQPAAQQFDTTALKNSWTLKQGAVFKQSDWESAKRDFLRQVVQTRYPRAQLTDTTASVDPDAHQATLHVTLDSGPEMRFGDLRIEGLKRYPASLVANLNQIKPGDYYSEAALQAYQARLQDTGYLDR